MPLPSDSFNESAMDLTNLADAKKLHMKPVSKIDRYAIAQVKAKRIEKGYSQMKLSYELDVSATFVGQVESRTRKERYTLDRLNEIAKILDCSPKDFMPDKAL
jgi:DNA-binding Xre family transcriptional regulator